MVTLKVVSYYDTWLGENKKAVLLEKGDKLYDASGLFSELKDFEVRNMLNVEVLFEEKLHYYDSTAEEQSMLLEKISYLEEKYGIEPFGGMSSKVHWVYVNGVSNIRAYQ